MNKLDNFSRILPRLHQGAAPPIGPELHARGFTTVVLCAAEYQPHASLFTSVEVLQCPFSDSRITPLSPMEKRMIGNTAAMVAYRLRHRARVYVSCAAGINRSGLVTALTVMEMTGSSGSEALSWVQQQRPGALSNPLFQSYLRSLKARPRRAAHLST